MGPRQPQPLVGLERGLRAPPVVVTPLLDLHPLPELPTHHPLPLRLHLHPLPPPQHLLVLVSLIPFQPPLLPLHHLDNSHQPRLYPLHPSHIPSPLRAPLTPPSKPFPRRASRVMDPQWLQSSHQVVLRARPLLSHNPSLSLQVNLPHHTFPSHMGDSVLHRLMIFLQLGPLEWLKGMGIWEVSRFQRNQYMGLIQVMDLCHHP